MPITVNGETVDPGWIQQEFSRIKSWHEQKSQASCCERDDEFLAEAKQNVIGRVLLVQEARQTMPEPEESQIRPLLDRICKDLEKNRIQPEEREMIRSQVAMDCKVDNFIVKATGGVGRPGDGELRAFYGEKLDRYTLEPRVRALHIYKSLRQASDREKLFRECCQVREELMEGRDFQEAARAFSDKPEEEVDLDWYQRGELLDEFEFVTFSMRVGEISPVFASSSGFHIAKVIDKESARAPAFEEIRDKVQQDLIETRKEDQLQAIVDGLREKASITEEPDES